MEIKFRPSISLKDIIVDEEDGEVIIFGISTAIVQKAKSILEFVEKHYVVSKNLTSRIIGQKGKQIQEIIDKSKGRLKIFEIYSIADNKGKSRLRKEIIPELEIVLNGFDNFCVRNEFCSIRRSIVS